MSTYSRLAYTHGMKGEEGESGRRKVWAGVVGKEEALNINAM